LWGENINKHTIDLNPKSTEAFGITNSMNDVISTFNKCKKIINSNIKRKIEYYEMVEK